MRNGPLYFLAACLFIAGGTAWGAPVEAIRIEYRVDPDSAEKAEMLADAIGDGSISSRETRKPANAKLFLHLAAGARDAKTVAVALEGMSRTWSRTSRGKRPKVDADFRAVVAGRLGDKNPPVRAGALAAARLVAGGAKPNKKMLDRIIKMAGSKSAADRIAAMQALFNVRDFQVGKALPGNIKAKIVAAHLANLDHNDTAVVAVALKNLARASYPGMPEKAKLQAKARVLAKHEKPEVRAPAVVLLAGLGDLKTDGPTLIAALSDTHPHVRASGAMAVGQGGYTAGVHAVMGLLEDGAKARLSIEGFTALDGSKGRVVLPTYAPRVDEAALEALHIVSAKTGKKFKFDNFGVKERAKRRTKTVAAARVWYDSVKGKLPKAPASAAPKAPAAP